MNIELELSRRVFWHTFSILCAACVVAVLITELANNHAWTLSVLLAGLLIVCALVSFGVARKIAGQSRQLAASIKAKSLNRAEADRDGLQGSVYEEAASAWQAALREIEDSYFDKEAEAGQHYAALTELMRMLALAVDERTSYLRGHSDRVASYASEIARELGMNAMQVERIRLAALLHDIGTLGIQDAIVMKEAPLTPEEFEIVKAHTVKGASILRPIEALADLVPGVELHHESLDGTGYPFALSGEEIPVMARVIAVADSFDAMTTARPYQSAMDPEYVLEVLSCLADKRYDATVVNALTALVKRGSIVVKNLRPPVTFIQRRFLSEVL